jgi:putative ATPase
MSELGYGKAYRYAHDEPHAYAAGENYFPDGIEKPDWYQPVPRGLELKIAEKLAFLRKLDQRVSNFVMQNSIFVALAANKQGNEI